ncbi:hypothetical protein GmHk_16G046452 [Glycine max]|nr:hypothetical protein GmHk_16G046452 [Glycine max]
MQLTQVFNHLEIEKKQGDDLDHEHKKNIEKHVNKSMIEHTSNMPFSSIIRPSNGLGAIACYDSFENKLGVGISPSSIPNAHYLTFRRALLCAPNNI